MGQNFTPFATARLRARESVDVRTRPARPGPSHEPPVRRPLPLFAPRPSAGRLPPTSVNSNAGHAHHAVFALQSASLCYAASKFFAVSTAGTAALGNEFYPARGWVEDNMNRRDRELLDRQMSRIQSQPRRDGVLILGMVGVFIAGLTAGSLLFTFGSNPSTPTASDDGRTALAFFLNGTGKTTRQ